MTNGTLICCEIGKVASRIDGSISITLETPEISGGKVGELFDLRKKVAYVFISAKTIEANDMRLVNSLDPEISGKTPGQRLRAVMYRRWEQDNEGYKDSNSYYIAKMELIINTYKAELL